jgi:hypothetical protein
MQTMLQAVIYTYSKLQNTSNDTICAVSIYITLYLQHMLLTQQKKNNHINNGCRPELLPEWPLFSLSLFSMALRPFGPWPLFHFLNPIHSH